jgi:hypothetical protein
VNQGSDNIIVTYNVNRSELGSQAFDIFSSTKVLTDVEPEDVCDVVEFMLTKSNIAVATEIEL